MINKEEIVRIKKEIDGIQKSINDLDEQKRLKAKELLDMVLSCREVLNETTWVLNGDQTLCSYNSKHKMLSEFLQTDYHCHFENDDLYLNFDDWDISLDFKSPESLTAFIEKFGIHLNIDYLKEKLESNKKDTQELEAQIARIEKINAVAGSQK